MVDRFSTSLSLHSVKRRELRRRDKDDVYGDGGSAGTGASLDEAARASRCRPVIDDLGSLHNDPHPWPIRRIASTAAPLAAAALAAGRKVAWIEDFHGEPPVDQMPSGVEFVATAEDLDLPVLLPDMLPRWLPRSMVDADVSDAWAGTATIDEDKERDDETTEDTMTTRFDRPTLKALLPLAILPDGDETMTIDEAVQYLPLSTLGWRPVGDVVAGTAALPGTPDPGAMPTLVRHRLARLLPPTWAEVAQTPVGELLALDGIGEKKVRVLLGHVASQVAASGAIPTAHPERVRARSMDMSTAVAHRRLLDAITEVAAWGQVNDYPNLVEALQAAISGRSDSPVVAISHLRDLDLATIAGAEQIARWDPIAAAERLLSTFDERERVILERRVLRLDAPDTLEALAETFELTRERVRQLEARVEERLPAMPSSPEFQALRGSVTVIRDRIGVACPLDELPPHVQSDDGTLADELLLWLAGPYRIDGNWVVRQPRDVNRKQKNPAVTLRGLVEAAFESVAVDDIAPRDAVHEALTMAGIHPERCSRLVQATGILETSREHDVYTRPPKTIAGRAKLHLRLAGRPMTFGELAALEPRSDNDHSIRNAVNADDDIVKVGPKHVALAEWDPDEYPGIVDAMVAALQDGPVPLAELQRALADRYSISPNSIQIHASMHHRFLFEDGLVRLRPADRPYVPSTDLPGTRDLFLVDGAWSYRTRVDHDVVLHGSGFRIPEAFAVHLGLMPEATKYLDAPARSVHLGWTQSPNIGSIRLNVLDAGLEEGDHVFIRRATPTSLDFVGVPAGRLTSSSPEERLRLLSGGESAVVDPRPWPVVVAEAIGMPTTADTDAAAVLSRLADRKQTDLTELAQALL